MGAITNKNTRSYFGISDIVIIVKKIAIGILVYLIPIAIIGGGLFIIQSILK